MPCRRCLVRAGPRCAFQRYAWLNPEPQERWEYVQSISIARQLLADRMYPLTLHGLDDEIRALKA